ncbi:pyroglutamyl-peptidase I [Roseiarcus fermentans]|uniref:pyroglutamyl-peptidase I n=1 Tax=Roseiarcus fermentans TaxID=1473586 RepID=UPI0014735995|nr:pyroglutamyl-peptidase I [Roseiarcus fermentans]
MTAFEPFGGETVNASWEAARQLDGWRCGEVVVAARMLPCAYDVSVAEFFASVESLRPCAVLMTGQAARRATVCVERFARNAAHASAPDNRGSLGPRAADGPDAIESTTSALRIAWAIRQAGIPARVSTDAGDYVCNHLYYYALRRLAEASQPIPAVFIHLPATPEQTPAGASRRRLATPDAVLALRAAVEVVSAPCVG